MKKKEWKIHYSPSTSGQEPQIYKSHVSMDFVKLFSDISSTNRTYTSSKMPTMSTII